MARFYAPINLDLFKEKVFKVYETCREDGFTSVIEKDLSKVEFDRENMTDPDDNDNFSNYPIGFKTIAPDFHVMFCNAGGDWEFPICFIIYWDGKKLRGYIPEDGNAYNKKTKIAYGSEDWDSPEAVSGEQHPEIEKNEVSEERIIKDILDRIKLK